MSSPIFDSTFGTGRFRREEPMTTSDQSQAAPTSPAEIARKLAVIELGVSDETFIGKIAAAIRATLAQYDAELAADAKLIEAAEWLSTAASRFEEAADAVRSEYKTYARQLDRLAGDTRERARLLRIFSCSADRGVHGELIPDCPTEGVAARQGNGG